MLKMSSLLSLNVVRDFLRDRGDNDSLVMADAIDNVVASEGVERFPVVPRCESCGEESDELVMQVCPKCR